MSETNERSVASTGSFLVERCTMPVFLGDLRPGLFVDEKGFVGFKSEYFVNDPERMEVFCADTGEAYWGGTSSTNDRASILVYPASISE
jgi:hypothetical protein